jgi:predicted nucleotidyltransferase
MEEYIFLEKSKKDEIIGLIKNVLVEDKRIVFAYVYGSFLGEQSFRDVDIGVYVDGAHDYDPISLEAELSDKAAKSSGMEFDRLDIRLLNQAPGHFLKNVFSKGLLLFSRDETLLADIIEKTSLDALANEYVSAQSFFELTSDKNGNR